MDLDQALIVANLATLPTEGLIELERALLSDILQCRAEERFALVGKLCNVLDQVRAIVLAREQAQAA